jgi:hypothetical protein
MGLLIWLTVGMVNDVQTNPDIDFIWREAFFVYALGMYVLAFIVFALVLRIPELETVIGKVAARLPYGVRRRLDAFLP